MCDRISQLQDQINQLAEQMCNATGILQQTAAPCMLPNSERLLSATAKPDTGDILPEGSSSSAQAGSKRDYPALFAAVVTRAARDVDFLIDQLPPDDANLEQQLTAIKKMESQNQDAVRNLTAAVAKGRELMARIQTALQEIVECEMEIRKLDI